MLIAPKNLIYKRIEKKIQIFFIPEKLIISNESKKHKFSFHFESHFKIILVSKKFFLKNMINRHRSVYCLLRKELKKIHALELHTYSPLEWIQKKNTNFDSPICKKKDLL